jgi:hypothetical protein
MLVRINRVSRLSGKKRVDIPVDVLMAAYREGGETNRGTMVALAKRGILTSQATVARRIQMVLSHGKDGSARSSAGESSTTSPSPIAAEAGRKGRPGRKKIEIPRELLLKAHEEGNRTFHGTAKALAGYGISVSVRTVRERLKDLASENDRSKIIQS